MTLTAFSPAARSWFASSFGEPTDAQRQGWPPIAEGRNTLLLAPTGSGKTLAAFLWAIDRMAAEPPPEHEARTRVLYISPLRALAVDVEKNLRAPLTGIQAEAERLGTPLPHVPTVGVRTGDTDARERRRLLRTPPDILITTPESLYLMLTSQARETLRSVTTVIIDEIHVMAATKRGSHLMLSLERLAIETQRRCCSSSRSTRGKSTPAGSRKKRAVGARPAFPPTREAGDEQGREQQECDRALREERPRRNSRQIPRATTCRTGS